MKNPKKIVLFDIDDVLFDTSHFTKSSLSQYKLYDDSREILIELANIAEIGILSQGETTFQLKKLLQTGIHSFFAKKHIHIVLQKDESLKDILKNYRNYNGKIYFVDDRLNNLFYAKQALPSLVTILIKRGRYINKNTLMQDFIADASIENLRDIIPLLNTES